MSIMTTLKQVLIHISIFVHLSFINGNKTEGLFDNNDLSYIVDLQSTFCSGKYLCFPTSKVNVTEYNGKLPVSVTEFTNDSCCDVCSCDKENCATFGTCCPDIFDHVPTVVESFTRIQASCEYAQLREYDDSSIVNGLPLMMIRKCPNNFQESEEDTGIKDKCEYPEKYMDLECKVPVTDMSNVWTYQNVYCSKCHNASALIFYWKPYVTCKSSGDESLLYDSTFTNIMAAVEATTSCNILYEKPDAPFTKPSCRHVITECNVTGLWSVYDPLIEAACHAYTSVYYEQYNNIFCAMCNEVDIQITCFRLSSKLQNYANTLEHVRQSFLLQKDSNKYGAIRPFSALLKFKPDSDSHHSSVADASGAKICSDSQVFDKLMNVCRNMTCRFPKKFDKEHCVNAVDTLQGVAYKLYLKLYPDRTVSSEELDEVVNLIMKLAEKLNKDWGISDMVYSLDFFYKESGIKTNTTSPESLQPLPSLDIAGSNSSSTTDSSVTPPQLLFLNSTIPQGRSFPSAEYFLLRIRFYFSGYQNVAILDNILDIDGHSTFISNKQLSMNISVNISLEDFTQDNEEIRTQLMDINDNETFIWYPKIVLFQVRFSISKLVPEVIAEKFRCPLIKIRQTEFITERRLNGVFIREINTIVPMKYIYEIPDVNDTIQYLMCANVYLQHSERFVKPNHVIVLEENSATAQGILSIVCTCLSVICCILTLITYALFKDLRTQPGINNIFLIVNLIFAQCFFQFGLLGYGGRSMWTCKIIGIFVHFFWLMVIFSMNVCSFHMFKVFINISKAQNSAKKFWTTSLYFGYCVIASTLFVSVNILVSMVTSDSEDVGYSAQTCYISRQYMIGYTFALPVGVAILSNLTMFIIIVVKVSRLPTLNTNVSISRNCFKMYAKISTITGVTWIFGFLFVFTELSFFEYIFILFNASQGLFIFFAFVFNRRVLNLYKERLNKGKTRATEISDDNKSRKTKESSLTVT